MQEQQEEAARQEQEAGAAREQLRQQQQEVEQTRTQLLQQRSALETAQAQVRRSAAGAGLSPAGMQAINVSSALGYLSLVHPGGLSQG